MTLPAIEPYSCERCGNTITLRGPCAFCGYVPLPAPYGTKYPEPAFSAYEDALRLQDGTVDLHTFDGPPGGYCMTCWKADGMAGHTGYSYNLQPS